ncbi:hypothetical protein Forpi1262_v013672 [Fusarium oxysporum f. sp. raphani]|uniref:Uncharacterized protein n=1 Tax=Fusarium oxysporum f. sp. raphani TaxID=96318 RepID=A0A8J5PXV9_FUSOX|nr:hypothetical protein Forpi1262_v013672 [Fusarium oxysporum f. sp. raphani]
MDAGQSERPSSSKTLTLSDVNNRLQSLEVKVRGDPHLRRNVADTPLASGSSSIYFLHLANVSSTLT